MPSSVMMFISILLSVDSNSLAPWNTDHHPTDVVRQESRELRTHEASYVIIQGGTMDGENCRSPQGVWEPFHQSWESNRSVRLENIGTTNVVNPWLSNGRNDFRSVEHIVSRAVKPGMTDRERAMALWWQEIQYRFHFEGDNNELLSPVKVFNVYGHNTCGNDSICLAGQWKLAGLKVAPARLVGHCVTQVYFDGGWHLFDGDMHSIYLLRDNQAIAGEQDLVRDHDLIKRTHSQGILQPDRRATDEWQSSIYVFEGDVNGDRNADIQSNMNMTLRPGESLVWRWGHLSPVKYHGARSIRYPDRVCNGLWEYRPDFANSIWRQGATSIENIRDDSRGLRAEDGKTGTIIWTMQSPYVFVGGTLDLEGHGAKFAISWDGKTWDPIEGNFDSKFPPQGVARYTYHLRCQLAGESNLSKLAIINDLQMAPLTLPAMTIGSNKFVCTHQSGGDSLLRVTHVWVERSASSPPIPPTRPSYPQDGGVADGTEIAFQWEPAVDPDDDRIADYHFELSAYSDMRHPLSMNFAKLISRTPERGHSRYKLSEPGLLNPSQQYFWRVRTQDSRGVWGAWSQTWSFTADGPAVPEHVALAVSEGRGILRWKPNRVGTRPESYRVYASDEKGFSISDHPYKVSIGVSKDLPVEFPANFLAETPATEFPVVGVGIQQANANKSYYRVVAVDAKGRRSGPSDYASAPRPFIYSRSEFSIRVGEEFRHSVSCTRSIGDLRMRMLDGKETTGFWDIENPQFRILSGPQWLTISKDSGRLLGTPDRPGTDKVKVEVKLRRDLRRLDGDALKWGVEKILESGTEWTGNATQELMIHVAQ